MDLEALDQKARFCVLLPWSIGQYIHLCTHFLPEVLVVGQLVFHEVNDLGGRYILSSIWPVDGTINRQVHLVQIACMVMFHWFSVSFIFIRTIYCQH